MLKYFDVGVNPLPKITNLTVFQVFLLVNYGKVINRKGNYIFISQTIQIPHFPVAALSIYLKPQL
jgi:hypothetical protein